MPESCPSNEYSVESLKKRMELATIKEEVAKLQAQIRRKKANEEWSTFHFTLLTPPKKITFGEKDTERTYSVNKDGKKVFASRERDIRNFDGPSPNYTLSFADSIEIWYSFGFADGKENNCEFWNLPQIQEFKALGYFDKFKEIMECSLNRYSDGENVIFKSRKSPFKMEGKLKSNIEKMLESYRKVTGTNPYAKSFNT